MSSARNIGIEEARGEYILFCDCDDIVEPMWCEVLLDTIEKFPNSFPMCWIRWIFDNPGVEPRVDCIKSDSVDENILYHNRDKDELYVFFDNIILYSPCNKIYRTSIIKQNNIYFEVGKSRGEDAVFNFKYLSHLNGKTVTVNRPLYNYVRQNPNSLIYSSTLDGALYVEYLYENFKDLFCTINLMEESFLSTFYQSYLKQYIRYFFVWLHRKNVSKSIRIKNVWK